MLNRLLVDMKLGHRRKGQLTSRIFAKPNLTSIGSSMREATHLSLISPKWNCWGLTGRVSRAYECSTVQYSTVQYNYSTVQYSTSEWYSCCSVFTRLSSTALGRAASLFTYLHSNIGHCGHWHSYQASCINNELIEYRDLGFR